MLRCQPGGGEAKTPILFNKIGVISFIIGEIQKNHTEKLSPQPQVLLAFGL